MKLAYSLPNAVRIHKIVLRDDNSKPLEATKQ